SAAAARADARPDPDARLHPLRARRHPGRPDRAAGRARPPLPLPGRRAGAHPDDVRREHDRLPPRDREDERGRLPRLLRDRVRLGRLGGRQPHREHLRDDPLPRPGARGDGALSGPRTARVAVVGCGWWSTYTHIPGLKAYERAELVALCDPDEARLSEAADRYGVARRYTSLDEMLRREKLDGAVVATYHATHHEAAS